MLRRAASTGSSGSLPNMSSSISRMKRGLSAARQIGRRPTPIQGLTVRVMGKMLARLVGIDQLAVDRAENSTIGKMKQRDHHGREEAQLETEKSRAGEWRDDEHHGEG